MNTIQELQAQAKALQAQIKQAQIKEQEEKAKEQAQAQEELNNLDNELPRVKELAQKIRKTMNLKETLLKKLKVEDLEKQNGEWRVNVIKNTSEKQREDIKKYGDIYIYNRVREHNTTQAQQDIIRAKKAYRKELKENKRKLYGKEQNHKQYVGKEWRESIAYTIKSIANDYNSSSYRANENMKEINKYLNLFFNEEQAQVKLNELIKPLRVERLKRAIKDTKDIIKKEKERLQKLNQMLGATE